MISTGIDRAGAFVVGHGGWWLNEDATEPTANTPEVLAALEYLQENISAGHFALANQVDAGWGGEAFGTGRAAMTIEGNWIHGALQNDYPDIDYTVVELPEGPAGKGTLLFTQCWGIAADSDAEASIAIRELIEQRIAEGASDERIRDELAAAYGEQVLLTPRSDGVSGLVWAVPVVALVLAFAGLAYAFVRWRGGGTARASEADRALVEQARRKAGEAVGS